MASEKKIVIEGCDPGGMQNKSGPDFTPVYLAKYSVSE